MRWLACRWVTRPPSWAVDRAEAEVPGHGGLATKETKGRRRRQVPIIEPLRATLERLTVGRARDARLLVGPHGGVITTATLRDATGWDELVMILGWRASCGTAATHGADLVGRRRRRAAPSAACSWPSRPGRDEPLSPPGSPGRPRRRTGILALVGPIWAKLPRTEACRGWPVAG